jgi:ring-1,2-phenylacetyl-CoA epoxidase subunit PaaC
MSQQNDHAALKDLLYRMADDEVIIAHRNSEWTGLGPILEEDIAFSSIAQDKLGHSFALFQILHELGEGDPDTVAFARNADDYRCCQLVEYPIGEYDFSLMRHYLFDTAEALRFAMLEESSYEPLAKLAKKVRGEIKYHVYHADTWVTQLAANGNDESRIRMQRSLDDTFPMALGIFEPSDYEDQLREQGIFAGEAELQKRWLETITGHLTAAGLTVPSVDDVTPAYGGRKGYHTEHLQPLLEEMGEVFRIDPSAEW